MSMAGLGVTAGAGSPRGEKNLSFNFSGTSRDVVELWNNEANHPPSDTVGASRAADRDGVRGVLGELLCGRCLWLLAAASSLGGGVV